MRGNTSLLCVQFIARKMLAVTVAALSLSITIPSQGEAAEFRIPYGFRPFPTGNPKGRCQSQQIVGATITFSAITPNPELVRYGDLGGNFYLEIRHWYDYVYENRTQVQACLDGPVYIKSAAIINYWQETANNHKLIDVLVGWIPFGGYVLGAGAAWHADRYQKLANDPPDPDFAEAYELPEATISLDWGFSAEANNYLNATATTIFSSAATLTGQLTSMEREQGAAVAGDSVWENLHRDNFRAFTIQSEYFSNEAARLLRGLPALLEREGIVDQVPEQSEVDAARDTLEAEGIPENVVSQLIAMTGNENIEQETVEFLLSFRGQPVNQSFFQLVEVWADQLTILTDISADTDEDLALDGADNCPLDSNPDQADLDFDGIGDACDFCPNTVQGSYVDVLGCPLQGSNDNDGDGVADLADNCPFKPNADQRDENGNGIGDACEAGVEEKLASLLNKVTGQEPGKSLANKIRQAQGYYVSSNIASTCEILGAFMDQVRAQAGKKISRSLAGEISVEAREIAEWIGCL